MSGDRSEESGGADSEFGSALASLLTILDLDPIENDFFRGVSPSDRWQRVYGGQVLGQALVAASRFARAQMSEYTGHWDPWH